MDNFILRHHIRKIISEFFNNSLVYTYGPNEFPYFDGNEKTPSDLDAEFDSEFDFMHDEMGESEENKDLNKSLKKTDKNSIKSDKH